MAALRRLILVAAVAALAAPAAQAGLISGLIGAALPSCGSTSQPFGQFGDLGSYYAVPNNGLEQGSTGWTLTRGASVVADNEPFNVGGAGRAALALPPHGSATSPPACINLLAPWVRGFAVQNGANGPVRVDVLFRGLTGNLLGILNVGTLSPNDHECWAPTAKIPSLLALPILTRSVQVRFTSLASTGTWELDDLYVDPWAHGMG